MSITGSCHCGATRFEIAEAPGGLLDCNCTFCAKRGALWAYYQPAQVKVVSREGTRDTYLFGPKIRQHHFCKICGCTTHTNGVDWETGEPQVVVNARLFDDLDWTSIPVESVDGRTGW